MHLTVNRCAVGLKGMDEPNLSPAIIIDLHQPDHVTTGRLLAPFSFTSLSLYLHPIHIPAKGALLGS